MSTSGAITNYPKYVFSLDEFDMSRNGIKPRNIRDFLVERNGNETLGNLFVERDLPLLCPFRGIVLGKILEKIA